MARRAELVGLRLVDLDLDLDLDVALVLGKGRRERALPFGRKTAVALDRYLPVRSPHKDAVLSWAVAGPARRAHRLRRPADPSPPCEQAGLPGLHTHQLHHSLAHEWLTQGGG